MNIVILGAGKIGSYVAATLSEEEHNVILIDQDIEALERVGREIDVARVHSFASTELLGRLLEQKVDLFFAATGNDETNLAFCAIAKKIGFPKTVCRIGARDYLVHPKLDFGSLFLVDHFLGPEVIAAQDLCKTLIHSKDLGVEHFAHGAIQMRTIQIPTLWDKGGAPISQLGLPDELIAGLIRRKMETGDVVLIPRGGDHILPGDQLTIFGKTSIMHKVHEIFHSLDAQTKSVIIVGGSSLALHIAQFLSEQKIHIRIIEKKKKRCEELAEILPQATIIHRDGRDLELLRSEGVQDADAFIACTHFDETNFTIAALAKEAGAPKSIAFITNGQLISILSKVGVVAALSPRVHVANKILSILDEGSTLSVTSLSSDAAKIVEMKVAPTSKAIGTPIADLHLPKDSLIAMIESKGQVMIGRGNQILKPEDVVIAICEATQIPKLQQLFH